MPLNDAIELSIFLIASVYQILPLALTLFVYLFRIKKVYKDVTSKIILVTVTLLMVCTSSHIVTVREHIAHSYYCKERFVTLYFLLMMLYSVTFIDVHQASLIFDNFYDFLYTLPRRYLPIATLYVLGVSGLTVGIAFGTKAARERYWTAGDCFSTSLFIVLPFVTSFSLQGILGILRCVNTIFQIHNKLKGLSLDKDAEDWEEWLLVERPYVVFILTTLTYGLGILTFLFRNIVMASMFYLVNGLLCWVIFAFSCVYRPGFCSLQQLPLPKSCESTFSSCLGRRQEQDEDDEKENERSLDLGDFVKRGSSIYINHKLVSINRFYSIDNDEDEELTQFRV